jgi:hypothetical protein
MLTPGRLRLVSAARFLFTAGGRAVTALDLRASDLAPDAAGLLPPLWVSSGEPFIDPAKEGAIKALKQELYELKKQLRDLCDRLGVKAAGTADGFADEADRSMFQQLQAGRDRLRELQRALDRLVGAISLDDSSRLAGARRAVRVRARKNGGGGGAWKVCWGSTLPELLASCCEHLGIGVRRLYTSRGLPVVDVSTLRVDQHVYASCGEPFVDPNEARRVAAVRSELSSTLRAQRSGTS